MLSHMDHADTIKIRKARSSVAPGDLYIRNIMMCSNAKGSDTATAYVLTGGAV
jgi:hypothetical protein